MSSLLPSGLNDATWIAGLLALCGPRLGGAIVADGVADSFLASYAAATEGTMPLRTVPSSMPVEALTGSIDLATTLAMGRPVHAAGLLVPGAAQRLLVRRAERLEPGCTALLAQALDAEELLLVAVLDPHDPDAVLSPRLEDRLPFRVEGDALPHWTAKDISAARVLLGTGEISSAVLGELCSVAVSLGINSPRAVVQALTVARGIAALSGMKDVDEGVAALAARLVLAHRAQRLPPDPESQPDEVEDQTPPPPSEEDVPDAESAQRPEDAEVILEAVKSALPAALLQMAGESLGKRGSARNVKGQDQRKAQGLRGKRIGSKRASSLAGQRLDILATLRTAAPWQALRRSHAGHDRMVVTRDDFRVARIKQRNPSTAIFAVDASGSTAFQRLAEAKGAVETILADCYVRRDRVALVSFRSRKAEVLLPPTRSLERAKRALASLPGGGGTPLAAGLDEAFALAVKVRREGGSPIVILLTDGRANVTRSGEGNKVKALEETQSAARLFAAEGFKAMLIDVSSEPQKSARGLAALMHATYLPMPRASATDIARPIARVLKDAQP